MRRAAEAVTCPDDAWLRERVASLAGSAGQAGRFELTLSKQRDTWRAAIQRVDDHGPAAAERVLYDRSTSCRPLAEAAAVTLAILADDFAQQGVQRESPPAPPPQEAKPPPAAPTASEVARAKVWVGAGGGAALSFISPVSPMLGFGLGLDTSSLRQNLRVMVTTEQKFALAPGYVFVQAWLVTALSCARWAKARFGVAACAALDASMLRASAEGFEQGQPSSRAHAAGGVESQLSWNPLDSYRISAALGAMLPFTRESFSVTGLGVAYLPPQINWRILLLSEIGAF